MSLYDDKPELFQRVDDPVDGLTFDADTGYVLWTAYDDLTYVGFIAKKPGNASAEDRYEVVVEDRHRPRAVDTRDG